MNIEKCCLSDMDAHFTSARRSFFQFLRDKIDILSHGYKRSEKDPQKLKRYLVKKFGGERYH